VPREQAEVVRKSWSVRDVPRFSCSECEMEWFFYRSVSPCCKRPVSAIYCVRCTLPSPPRAERCLHCGWPLVEFYGKDKEAVGARVARRHQQLAGMRDREIIDFFPYFEWITIGDGVPGINGVRAEHAALHGVVFRWDDPLWEVFFPPTDEWCRCSVVGLTPGQVRKPRKEVMRFVRGEDDIPLVEPCDKPIERARRRRTST